MTRRLGRNLRRGFWACWLGLTGVCVADDRPPLPNPLTLAQALALADAPHPTLELAAAGRDRAQADLASARALTGARLTVEGALRVVQPSNVSSDRDNNDSFARFGVRKRLYDFGFTEATTGEAKSRIASRAHTYLDARQQRRLDIMQRYFDVLLADLEFARDNEAMATAFVAVDKARDRNELGQVSDIDLLELGSIYQTSRARRFAGQARQRAARARLAHALNRPGQLPADLLMPEGPDTRAPVPEYSAMLEEVLANNLQLLALRAAVAAAEQAIAAADAAAGPVLHGELAAATYNRPTSSRNPLAAGLALEIPLDSGGVRAARLAVARAEARTARARLAQAELDVRQAALDTWLELGQLRVRLEAAEARADYRELYLDRTRALYELEVQTDLGDAMVQTSAARLEHAQVILDWLLTDARLKALAGRLLDPRASADSRQEKTP